MLAMRRRVFVRKESLYIRHKPVLYRNHWKNPVLPGFCRQSFLPPIPCTLYCKEILISPEIRVLPS